MRKTFFNRIAAWRATWSLATGAGLLIGTAAQAEQPVVPANSQAMGADALSQQSNARLQYILSGYQDPMPTTTEGPAPVAPPPAPVAEAPAEEGPWLIIDQMGTAKDNGWQVGGWTQFGYQNNPDGAFCGNSVFLDDRYEWDRLNLNQQWFYIGKVANGENGLGLGFRMDMVYGVDGNDTQSFGNQPGEFDFLNGWDHGIYEWAMPQLYVEAAYGNTTLKLGHFFTLLGYEVVPSGGNFFLSRQLTFYNSEPFTHTGALAATKINDKLTVHNGWVLGMDSGFDQLNQANAYHGGLIYQITPKTSLIYMLVGGNLGWRGDGSINSFVVSQAWTDKFTTVHQFDVLNSNTDTDFATQGIAGDSTGLINYAFYQITDRTKAGIRYEWYKADSVSYNTLTYGVNIFPVKNLVIRPEVRHMWSPGNDIQYVNSSGGTENLFNETVVGIDAILTY